MAYALINHVEAGLGANGGTTGSIDTTGASFLVLNVSYYDPGTAPTISDSKSNTWSALTLQSSTGSSRLYYCASPSVGTGHTFSANGTGSYPSLQVLAFSGSHGTPFDQQNGATSAGATSLATGSITPSEDNELVIAGLVHGDNTAGAVSIDGGFTAYKNAFSSGNNMGGGIAYLIQTTATAANPSWSVTTSTQLAATIASFKAAAGGATVYSQFWWNSFGRPLSV